MADTTTTFTPVAASQGVYCSDAAYANAVAGLGTKGTETSWRCGQWLTGGVYYIMQNLSAWDTSAIPDDNEIKAVKLMLNPYSLPAVDFDLEVRAFDWGASVDAADFRSAAQLSALTLLATRSTAAIGYSDAGSLVGNAAFLAAINRAGPTVVVLDSAKQISGSAPAANDLFRWINADLVVTYGPPSAAAGGVMATRRGIW